MAGPLVGWAAYRPFAEQFFGILDEERYPIAWLDAQVWAGFIECFATDSAAILFERRVFPSGLAEVHGMAAVGDLEAIRSVLIPAAEQWGREHDCALAAIESRPAWAKLLPDYAVEQVRIAKELGHGA